MNTRIATALWIAQLLATLVMVTAVLYEIESILFTCPLLTLVGLALAAIGCRLDSSGLLIYGVSAPLVCAAGAGSIAVNQWGPSEARAPITLIAIVYSFLCAPMAAWSFSQIRRMKREGPRSQSLRWQFGLKSVLLLMTVICVSIVGGKFFFRYVSDGTTFFFGGYAIACIAFSLWPIRRFMTKDYTSKVSE